MKETCNNCRYFHDADQMCWLHNEETSPIKVCNDWKGYML